MLDSLRQCAFESDESHPAGSTEEGAPSLNSEQGQTGGARRDGEGQRGSTDQGVSVFRQ